jgi:transcriptional regulator with XRE-family HTH domain
MNINKERLKRGLSRKEFGDKLGVAPRTVEAWEQGLRKPSKQIILLIENGALDEKE